MKRMIIILALLLAGISAAEAEKPLGVQEINSIDELAWAVAVYFPKVQGEVSAVQGKNISITLGKKDGIVPGMTLTVWRVAKEILHPVTNAVIGRTEEEVGMLEITSPEDRSATGVLIKKRMDPRPGDKVRITPRKINLAVVPLQVDSPEIAADLSKSLSETGRFSVPESSKVEEFLKERKGLDTALVREMGRTFGLDAVVTLSSYPTEGRHLITAQILYADDARPLDTITTLLAIKTKTKTLGEVKPFFTPVKEEKALSAVLPFHALLFAAGDFDGDGTGEYAFSDGSRLSVYRQEPAGWHELWTETVSAADAGDLQHFSLDAADINANGRSELFVTAMFRGKVVSSVTEWQDGTFRRIADLPVFLRVVDYPGRGEILIGQDFDPVKFYADRPREYSWSGGQYVPGAPFALPRDIGLYGFTFADFGEQSLFLVARDEDDKLVAYSGESRAWKSEEEYPGADIVVLKPASGFEAALREGVKEDEKERQMKIKERILALDVNGDGRDEIVLPKHKGGFLFLTSPEAELRGLRWTGARLDNVWSVKDIPGIVLDTSAAGQGSAGGSQIRALVRDSGGLFTKQKERVIIFTLK